MCKIPVPRPVAEVINVLKNFCRKSNRELDTWMAGEAQVYKDTEQKIPVSKFIRETVGLRSMIGAKVDLSENTLPAARDGMNNMLVGRGEKNKEMKAVFRIRIRTRMDPQKICLLDPDPHFSRGSGSSSLQICSESQNPRLL
jgi:hypothetical protein